MFLISLSFPSGTNTTHVLRLMSYTLITIPFNIEIVQVIYSFDLMGKRNPNTQKQENLGLSIALLATNGN